MFKKIILVLIFSSIINIASAKVVEVDVNGLVCEFCAVAIEKKFKKQKKFVEKVKIDLETKKLFIYFKKGKNLSDDEIKNIVKNSGYNVEKINR